ncbi:hypothetical protein FJZ26_04175 [Candidatus Parvarchaeota archaeon]|nr:hypothetical protein [Candidatus Parvarchaeota archaeon]
MAIIDRRAYPYLLVIAVFLSLLFFYTAYDKKTKQLEFGKLVKVLTFVDVQNSIREFNKVVALEAIGLISIAFILGPLSRLWPRIFCSYLYFRKPVGVIGFVFALVHAIYSFVEFYKGDYGVFFNTQHPKFAALSTGLVALIVFAAMAITSTASAVRKMGYEKWKALQTTGYAGLVLTIIHFYIIETKPDIGFDVRPWGVAFFWLAIIALILRLVVIFIRTAPKTKIEHHVDDAEEYCRVALGNGKKGKRA